MGHRSCSFFSCSCSCSSGGDDGTTLSDPPTPYERIEVQLSNGRKLKVIDVKVRYIGEDGRPLSAKEFLDRLIKVLPGFFESEESLRTLWANPDSRDKLLKDLATVSFDQEQLDTLTEMFKAKDIDYYDLLSYLLFNKDIIAGIDGLNRCEMTKHILMAMIIPKPKNFYNSFCSATKQTVLKN